MEKLIKLGVQMSRRREFLKLTQQDVATATALSDATVRFIEKGKRGVSIGNWMKVCDLLGLEIQVLNKKMSDTKVD
jgi:DNA-binding XRE family transcriptional regulator